MKKAIFTKSNKVMVLTKKPQPAPKPAPKMELQMKPSVPFNKAKYIA